VISSSFVFFEGDGFFAMFDVGQRFASLRGVKAFARE